MKVVNLSVCEMDVSMDGWDRGWVGWEERGSNRAGWWLGDGWSRQDCAGGECEAYKDKIN